MNNNFKKIQISILKLLNENYHKTNIKYLNLDELQVSIIPFYKNSDENDFRKALNYLSADSCIEIKESSNRVYITDVGIRYLKDSSNKVAKFFSKHFFDITNLIK